MRHFIENQINTKNEDFSFKGYLKLIVFLVLMITVVFLLQYRKEKLLENYKLDKAVVTSSTYKNIKVKFKVSGKIIFTKGSGHYDFFDKLSKGDTILIKYAVEDLAIIEIVSYKWNEKTKRKLNNFKLKEELKQP
jgi:hypothetical protein